MLRLLFMLLLFTLTLQAVDRCHNLAQQVRVAHYQVFGLDYPYWYGIGQLRQESRCRNVVSKDGVGSQGVAQITFRVWKHFLSKKGINNLNNIGNQLHAQAYIMKNCKKQAYSSHLWVSYQIYNGGNLVNKEITKARKKLHKREISHREARCFCRRKVVHFNNGQSISACTINYDYSKKIYKYGRRYNNLGIITKYIYW